VEIVECRVQSKNDLIGGSREFGVICRVKYCWSALPLVYKSYHFVTGLSHKVLIEGVESSAVKIHPVSPGS
jgi:hypothetical protein